MKLRSKFSVIILIIVFLSFLGYFGFKFYKVERGEEMQRQKELMSVLEKAGELYLFPNEEVPTVAKVSDPEIFTKGSPFKDAIIEDRVLIFSKAGKAVLYRPSINKIIDVVKIESQK